VSEIHIVRDYPHPPAKVWRAVTDPALVPLWTVTGAGGRPEGFTPVVGTKFRLLAKPKPGWSGVVDCEVLEVNEPSLLRYSWTGDVGGDVTEVVYRLESHAGAPASPTTTPASPASAESSWPSCWATSVGRCSVRACRPYSMTLTRTAPSALAAPSGPSPWGDASRPAP